ncbi:MAG TPA: fumarylacetoacetate hydrolase family protein [Gemmatimonadaceae bacterium]|nr:fumarylacetoacetate hydrolase family protein [Gemmatimonadaceae bacterium]
MSSPSKIVCVGRNYVDHARELGNEVPQVPLLFMKPPSSIIPSGEPIVLPRASERVEYEGEIGVVIGTRAYRVSEGEAVRCVRGIVAVNDVTARDLQKTDVQWTRAKGFDTFCPLGAESAAPGSLEELVVITRLNGVERQRATAAEMVFSIPRLIAYISAIMTLLPGDVIATGTPAGVGPLASGDLVEVEVPGISLVTNPVRSDS